MRKLIFSVAAALLLAGQALAVEPTVVGSWNVTFALEPGKTLGATQCVVFTLVPGTVSGMPGSGTWVSPTFAGWKGQWIGLGGGADHVRWFGFTSGGLATEESGNVINGALVGGVSFNHFFAPGVTSSSGSWFATRVARCNTGTAQLHSSDPAR